VDQAQFYTTKLPSPYTFNLDVLAVHGASEPDHISKFPGIVHEFLDGSLAEQIAGGRRNISMDFQVMTSANMRRVVLWWLDPLRTIKTLVGTPGSTTVNSHAGGSLANGTYYYEIRAIDVIGGGITTALGSNDTAGGGDQEMNISWAAVTGARSYAIYRKKDAGHWFLLDYAIGVSYTDDGTATPLKDLGGAVNPPSAVDSISVITTNDLEFKWMFDTELARMLSLELREASIFTATQQFPV
jgi:hypothetical protein